VDFGCEVTFVALTNHHVVPVDHPGKVESTIGPLLIDPEELFSRTEQPPFEGTEIEERNTSLELLVKTSSSDMPGASSNSTATTSFISSGFIALS
jgi:hypothetical protein